MALTLVKQNLKNYLWKTEWRINSLTFNIYGLIQCLHNSVPLVVHSTAACLTSIDSPIVHLEVLELNYTLTFCLLYKDMKRNAKKTYYNLQ